MEPMTDLSPAARSFVLHWGEMGSRWGVNRTVAQVHALLYVSPRPLPAEDVANTLGLARSNVSTSLKELLGWGLVRVVHLVGDRRDHFESMADVWEMFKVILRERKRREIDPTLRVLRECAREAGKSKGDSHLRERLDRLLEFFETAEGAYEQVAGMSAPALKRLARLGGGLRRL